MMLSTCIKLQLSADQSRIRKKSLWARVIPYPITRVCPSLHKSHGYVSQWGVLASLTKGQQVVPPFQHQISFALGHQTMAHHEVPIAQPQI